VQEIFHAVVSRDIVIVGSIDRVTCIERGKVGSTEIVDDEISQLRLSGSTLHVSFFSKPCIATYRIDGNLIEKMSTVYNQGILSLQLGNGNLTAHLDELVYQDFTYPIRARSLDLVKDRPETSVALTASNGYLIEFR